MATAKISLTRPQRDEYGHTGSSIQVGDLLLMPYDRRWKSWAKLVTRKDVDLRKSNGYSLGGAWTRIGETVALHPGQYLVVAAESGSGKYHDYQYAVVTTEDDETLLDVTEQLRQAARDARVPDEFRAAAANSTLYAFALAIHHTAPAPVDPTSGEPDPLPGLIDQLLALKPEQQARLLIQWRDRQTEPERLAIEKAVRAQTGHQLTTQATLLGGRA